MSYLEAMQTAFFDELESIGMEKEASNAGVAYRGVEALGGKLLGGASGAQAAKFFGARAGIGAGVGAVGGGATSKDGNFARGAVRGALLGGAVGAGVGGAQVGRAAYRAGGAALVGKAIPQAAHRTLRRAGFGHQGLKAGREALRTGRWTG